MSLIQETLDRFERDGLDEDIREVNMNLGEMFTERTGEGQRKTVLQTFALAFAYGDIDDATHKDARRIVRNWEERTDEERLAVTLVYNGINEIAKNDGLGFQADAVGV